MFRSLEAMPVGTQGFGLIRRCMECRARNASPQIVCQGFGCGCLTRPWEPARPGFTYAPLLDVDTSLRGF